MNIEYRMNIKVIMSICQTMKIHFTNGEVKIRYEYLSGFHFSVLELNLS